MASKNILLPTFAVFLFLFSKIHGQEVANLRFGLRDLTVGAGVANIACELHKSTGLNSWSFLSSTNSTTTGSVRFPVTNEEFPQGEYKITAFTKPYFASKNLSSIYPYIEVIFEKTSNENYEVQIPTLISPYGYSFYRGSSSSAN